MELFDQLVERKLTREGLDEEEKFVVRYGTVVLIRNVSTVLLRCLLGFFLHCFWETVVYLVSFILIRRTTGGYHATSRLRCLCLSMAAWGLMVGVVYFQDKHDFYSWNGAVVICVLCLFIDIMLAPVEHPNKRLDDESKKRNRLLSVLLMSIAGACVLGTWTFLPRISSSILFSMVEIVVFMIIGERRYRNYDESKTEKPFCEGSGTFGKEGSITGN